MMLEMIYFEFRSSEIFYRAFKVPPTLLTRLLILLLLAPYAFSL
jgi:hypothetical protein